MIRISSYLRSTKVATATVIGLSLAIISAVGLSTHPDAVLAVVGSSAFLVLGVEAYRNSWKPSVKIPLGSILSLLAGGLLFYGTYLMMEDVATLYGQDIIGIKGIAAYIGLLYCTGLTSFGAFYSLRELEGQGIVSASGKILYTAVSIFVAVAVTASFSLVSQNMLSEGLRGISTVFSDFYLGGSVIGTAVMAPVAYMLLRYAWRSAPISQLIPEKSVYSRLSGYEGFLAIAVVLGSPVLLLALEFLSLPPSIAAYGQMILSLTSSTGFKMILLYVSGFSLAVMLFFKLSLKLKRGRGSLGKMVTPYIVLISVLTGISYWLYITFYDRALDKVLQATQDVALINNSMIRRMAAQNVVEGLPYVLLVMALASVPALAYSWGVSSLSVLKFIPRRGVGEAIAALGVFLTGLISIFLGSNEMIFSFAVVSSLIIWMMSRNSGRIKSEMEVGDIGFGPETMKLLGSGFIGVLSVGLVFYLDKMVDLALIIPKLSLVAGLLAVTALLLAASNIGGLRSNRQFFGNFTVDPESLSESSDSGKSHSSDMSDEEVDELVESHIEEVDKMIEEDDNDNDKDEEDSSRSIFDRLAEFSSPD